MRKLVILALIASAGTAFAASKEVLETHWLIEPPEDIRQPVRAMPGDVILRQQLAPSGLAILEGAYTESGPDRELSAGSQLFEVGGSEAAIYCSMGYRKPSSLSKLFSHAASGTHLCFIDRDRDSRFEMSFITSNTIGPLPSVYGRIPPADKPITPISYAVVDPQTFHGDVSVGIKYERKRGRKRDFGIVYGPRDRPGWLQAQASISVKSLPAEFELLGAKFIIREAADDQIVVEVVHGMPKQPFGIETSVMYY